MGGRGFVLLVDAVPWFGPRGARSFIPAHAQALPSRAVSVKHARFARPRELVLDRDEAETEAWAKVAGSSSISEIDDFLRAWPSGAHAKYAKARKRQLGGGSFLQKNKPLSLAGGFFILLVAASHMFSGASEKPISQPPAKTSYEAKANAEQEEIMSGARRRFSEAMARANNEMFGGWDQNHASEKPISQPPAKTSYEAKANAEQEEIMSDARRRFSEAMARANHEMFDQIVNGASK